MKKKFISIFAILFLGLFAFTGCKKNDPKDPDVPDNPTEEHTTHTFGDVTYTWDEETFECTAERKCSGCTVTEKETVQAKYTVTVTGTIFVAEEGDYVADFKNELFETQTKHYVGQPLTPDEVGNLIVECVSNKWIEGQRINAEDLTVYYFNEDSGEYEEVFDYEYNLEDKALKQEHTSIVVTYLNETYEYAIEVLENDDSVFEGVDIIVEDGLIITDALMEDLDKLAESFIYRVKYTTGTFFEYGGFEGKDLKVALDGDEIVIRIDKLVEGHFIEETLRYPNGDVVDPVFTAPRKTLYAKGEQLDLTGGSIVHIYGVGGEKVTDITEDLVDSTSYDLSTPGSYTVKITESGNEYSYNITVKDVPTLVKIAKPLKDTTFDITQSIDDVVARFEENALLVRYASTQDTMNIASGMLDCEWDIGTVTVTLKTLGFTETFDINVTIESTGLSDFLASTDKTASVYAIVVSNTYRGNQDDSTTKKAENNELVVKDYFTNETISLTETGIDYKPGQIIQFNATKSTFTTNGITRNTITAKEVKVLFNAIDDHAHYDLSQAITISTQAQMHDYFGIDTSDKENSVLKNNFYKLFKLEDACVLKYKDNLYRLYIKDCEAYSNKTTGATIFCCMDDLSYAPTIKVNVFEETVGIPLLDVFEDSASWGTKNSKPLDKDIYVICVGGTGGYYLDFIVVGAYGIVDRA